MVETILWAVVAAFVLSASLYFSFKLHFLQFHIPTMLKSLFSKEKTNIPAYQTLTMVLAARIGVGSISGVALALSVGGVGSLFWMWVVAFLCAINCYAETVLGMTYQEKDGNYYKGGPSYYLKNGLGYKKLGAIYAFIVLFSYLGGFLGIQSNTIVKSVQEVGSVPSILIGTLLVILTAFIIFGGVKKIASVSGKIVPLMTILYFGLSLFVILLHVSSIPTIFGSIFQEAFHLKPFLSGFLPMAIVGIQRALFSSEAGLGTGSIASSVITLKKPKKQGYIQMLGVYITILLVCTSTAIIILTSPYQTLHLVDLNGIEITQFAFSYHFGNFGVWFIMISILFFAFSTILTGYYYIEASIKYFKWGDNKMVLFLIKLLTLGIILWGSLASSHLIWKIIDLFVGLLALVNTFALFKLRRVVIKETLE